MDDPTLGLKRWSATIMCPHGGLAVCAPSGASYQSEYMLDTDNYFVAGCIFQLPSGAPSPCVRVTWMSSSPPPDPTARNRRKVVLPPPRVILPDSVGLCLSASGKAQGRARIILGGLSGIAMGDAWYAGQGGGTGPGDVW